MCKAFPTMESSLDRPVKTFVRGTRWRAAFWACGRSRMVVGAVTLPAQAAKVAKSTIQDRPWAIRDQLDAQLLLT